MFITRGKRRFPLDYPLILRERRFTSRGSRGAAQTPGQGTPERKNPPSPPAPSRRSQGINPQGPFWGQTGGDQLKIKRNQAMPWAGGVKVLPPRAGDEHGRSPQRVLLQGGFLLRSLFHAPDLDVPSTTRTGHLRSPSSFPAAAPGSGLAETNPASPHQHSHLDAPRLQFKE